MPGPKNPQVSPLPPRRFVDPDGVYWTVYEAPSSYDRRSRPTLVFESDAIVRRVREYPSRWRELSDEALTALSWAR
jgi:hypothetical protein